MERDDNDLYIDPFGLGFTYATYEPDEIYRSPFSQFIMFSIMPSTILCLVSYLINDFVRYSL